MTRASTGPARGSTGSRAGDLVRWPLVGPFLRWRGARPTLQVLLGLLALALVLHGLFGPQRAPKNLATLLVWVHWRGALVFGLLLVGNVFCTGCPLLLPRALARRLRSPVRQLPAFLRSKWTGAGLLVLVLFLYEWLDLWASPRATAVTILAYFGLALVVDASFRGAPFCKWVCPVGQFNFLASTASPFEVRVADTATCDDCRTKDCIRGRRAPERPEVVVQRGCELGLFLPRKVGNLDCTFCLDCVHACPEDNVAIALRAPAEELCVDPLRSGVGRLSRRTDLAGLTVLFTFGALLNAFGMVRPVYAFQAWVARVLDVQGDLVPLLVLFGLGLGVVPALTLGAVGLVTRAATGTSLRRSLTAGAPSLLPLGFGVWLAHYGFHFLTGLWTFVPVLQLTLQDLGVGLLGRPRWGLAGLTEAQVWPIELGLVLLGTSGSLAVAWRIARREHPDRPWVPFLGWALLHGSLAAAALWLLAQPMEMRGTYL